MRHNSIRIIKCRFMIRRGVCVRGRAVNAHIEALTYSDRDIFEFIIQVGLS